MTKEIMPKDVIMPQINVLFPQNDDESYLLVSCQRADYSASMLSRAVEDCDAQVLNLNVTSIEHDPAGVVVSLRINHRNPEAVVRSLSRYGYDVVDAVSGNADDNDRMRSRANEVLRYLEI